MIDSGIAALIEESRELEAHAAKIQGEDELRVGGDEIEAFVSRYHDWYAKALDRLPEGYHERFRAEFEGGLFTNKIKDFLQAPGDVSPLYDADNPNPLLPSRWSSPFDTTFRGPLLNQRQILTEARQQLEGAGQASQDLLLIERICRNFSEFLVPLTNRGRGKPPVVVADEYDLQDILHGLLRLFFDDVRPEDYAPKRAGARTRIDFILKQERIVVETKMTRDRLGESEVGGELIVDIERYQAHPDCGALVALVYDPERRIANRHGLESDLSRKHDGLTVRVYVVH